MPIVFTKSPRAAAMEKGLMALVAIIVGGGFAAIALLIQDLHMVVLIAAGLAVLMAIWMTIKLIGDAIEILKSGQEWRVEITDSTLSWHSPVPEIMQSFTVSLRDISTVRRVFTQYRNSNRSATNHFYIEFTNGYVLELKEQECGISPMKVFKALQTKSVNFIEDRQMSGSRVKITVG